MKKIICVLPILLLLMCASDPKTPDDGSGEASTGIETIQSDNNINTGQQSLEETNVEAATPPPPPPPTPKRDSIRAKIASKSPFLSQGCCSEKINQKKACCCEAVLEKYKQMVVAKDVKLAKYKMTDPILGACRRLMVAAFDKVDYPDEEEVDLDDLF